MNFVKGMLIGAIVGGSLMGMDKVNMHKIKRKMMKNGKSWARRMNIL